MPLANNTTLQGGKYRITRFIASGGFGCTYEGVHTALGHRVAIKEFFVSEYCNRDDSTGEVSVGSQSMTATIEKLRQKFLGEAKALFSLSHEGIVKVHDVFEENGTAYYVMDYIDGPTLSQVVKSHGAIPERKAVELMKRVSEAVAHVHSQNLLHLDIKPANIMLAPSGAPILIDFGIAKVFDESQGVISNTIAGATPSYAAPEQMAGDSAMLTPATDVYALGATLFYLISGEVPPTAALLISGQGKITFPNGITPATRNAVLRAMNLMVNVRPQSAEEFRRLLDAGSATGGTGEVTVPNMQPPKPPVNDSRTRAVPMGETPTPQFHPQQQRQQNNGKTVIAVVAAAAVVLLVVGAVLILGGSKDSPSPEPSPTPMEAEVGQPDSPTDPSVVVISSSPRVTYNKQTRTFSGNGSTMEMVRVTGNGTYYIASTETPQWLYKAVMGNNPSSHAGLDNPVENVSWYDADSFCNKLSGLTGQSFCLPTESQWEYAANGGNDYAYYTYSGSDNLDSVGWYDANSGGTTHACASKNPNALGLYDMSGNVFEWTRDWAGGSKSAKVGRSGSFKFGSKFSVVSHRVTGCKPSYCSDDLGFRIAID